MSIRLISISHKTAPLEVRELFAFTKEKQAELGRILREEGGAAESVIIATCNRTEIYTYFDAAQDKKKNVFTRLQELILRESGAVALKEDVSDYLRFYQDRKAVHHLLSVTAGLDSMVVGEDQILGQVKQAHGLAQETGNSGKYLNTLFRYAVTCAKRIKTDTELSKTSVSTATLAVKAAEEAFGGSLEGKNVMVIGGTGQIGGIVLKNLYSLKGLRIYSTLRNVTLTHDAHRKSESDTVIDYKERYDYIDDMDVIISATASPHYTLTGTKVKERLRTDKTRVFVDLAVPVDIEESIAEFPHTFFYNMDDFTELAEANNRAKKEAVQQAGEILEEYEEDFMCWMIFQQAVPRLQEVKQWMEEEAEKKGFGKAIDKLFYRIRENADPEELEAFVNCLREPEK
ncbi:glutamyl-tRNA reductase [Candidatus Merdisoma sp. HCP28S3_D10]|uniref:glutamyl-tRNA reductase n=1 Tax=unclassified Candidatus Merdisoma TaxID=3099611 RepID=UPI003F898689